MSFWSRLRDRAGMTLVEVMVSVLMLSLLIAVVYGGVTQGVQSSYLTAQRVSAFGVCKARLEQMRGTEYDEITVTTFPEQIVEMTHLGGSDRVPLEGTLVSSVTSLAQPTRKQVTVSLSWVFRGREYSESITGSIVDRNAQSGVLGAVSGTVKLHPNRTWPKSFKLWKPDGTYILKSDLKNPAFAGYTGLATHVRFKPGGADTQTTLLHNFQPYPIANAKRWDLDGPTMNVRLYKDIDTGKWQLDVAGTGVVISSR